MQVLTREFIVSALVGDYNKAIKLLKEETEKDKEEVKGLWK